MSSKGAIGGRRRYRSGADEKSRWSSRVCRLQREKAALAAEIRRLETENAAKTRRIEQLQKEVARLQAALAASQAQENVRPRPSQRGPHEFIHVRPVASREPRMARRDIVVRCHGSTSIIMCVCPGVALAVTARASNNEGSSCNSRSKSRFDRPIGNSRFPSENVSTAGREFKAAIPCRRRTLWGRRPRSWGLVCRLRSRG